VSAPSSSRLPALLGLLLVAAMVAGGCTVPGAGHVRRPPKDLAPSLDYVTADVMGFSLYDTNPGSKLWAPFGEDVAKERLAAVIAPVLGDSDPSAWIGKTEGVALRELNVDGDDDTSTLWFADVHHRGKLEHDLKDGGWKRTGDELDSPGESLTLWTRGEPTCEDVLESHPEAGVAGDGGAKTAEAQCFVARPYYRALAVADDAVIAAESTTALTTFLKAANAYAVPERKSMSEYAVEARKRTPASFVTRFDLIRTQLKRPFEGDPATLELARWATDSNTLVALRDGWLGVAPPLDREAEGRVRIVGASEWVPDLAPDLDFQPVRRDVFERLAPRTDIAVGIHDPGQQLRELVRAITFGSGQYVTEQDVAKEDRVALEPTLDELDGDAAIGWSAGSLLARIQTDDPEETATDLDEALETAGLAGDANARAGGIDVSVAAPAPATHRARAVANIELDPDIVTGEPPHLAELDDAGTPPRPPVLWLWRRGDACVGDAAGWVTFDNVDELRLSISVELASNPACPEALATRTLRSIGVGIS
jgi:hypothetical protein